MALRLTLPGVKASQRPPPQAAYALPPVMQQPMPRQGQAQPQQPAGPVSTGLDPVAVARLVSKAMGIAINPAAAAKLIAVVSALGNAPAGGNETL